MQALREQEGIKGVYEVLEGRVMIQYKERQTVGIVKGVSKGYEDMLNLPQLIKRGKFELEREGKEFAVIGLGVYAVLGCKREQEPVLSLYAPKRKEKINMLNPMASLNMEEVGVNGAFAIFQPEYDEHYVFVPLELSRRILDFTNEVTSLDISLSPNANVEVVKRAVQSFPECKNYVVKNRFEQQEDSFKMMQIEKWVTFLILIFILLIAFFNCIGSLSMLMIDKRDECSILYALGGNKRQLRNIFLWEGCLIGVSGSVIGILLGIVLCGVQQHFGLLKLGDAANVFLTDIYPVRLLLKDVLIIFITSISISIIIAYLTTKSVKISIEK